MKNVKISKDFMIYLRAELLSSEKHYIEVSTARSDVDQCISQIVLRSRRRILVQFIHEDDHLVNAELALFGLIPNVVDY